MSRPLLSRTAMLVLGMCALVVAAILAIGYIRDHRHVDVSLKKQATSSGQGVELKTAVSLRVKTSGLIDVVAAVTITNSTDRPIYYAGVACYAPARVTLETTLLPPKGPSYPPSVAVLRERVMEYRRSLEQIGYFTQEANAVSGLDPCDAAAPPTLPARRTLTYSMTVTIGIASQPYIDPGTTDVVTKLQLGVLPAPEGRLPPPVQVTSTITVRTGLGSLTDIRKASSARYDEVSQDFELLMRDRSVSAWIMAQDPSLWRQARLMDPYPQQGEWRLTAFNHAWATPLIVSARGGSITRATIPRDAWQPPRATSATIPNGASSSVTSEIVDRDIYVGDVYLPSGKVMVGDPVSSDGMLLFDYRLPPGAYAVHVVTAATAYAGPDYESVAWMELFLSTAPVTHWQAAIPIGHSASELTPGQVFSFGTDGAGAGFASPEAMRFMDSSLATQGVDIDDTTYGELGGREEANDWLYGLITVDSASGANVFATSTGSDGGFPVLLGLDAHDRPAVLLSDFNVLGIDYGGIHAT